MISKLIRELKKTSWYKYPATIRAQRMLRKDPALIVLSYHEFFSRDSFPGRKIGTELTVEDFHGQTKWLKKRFSLVRLQEEIRQLRENSLKDTCVEITFDDGHIGVETLAYDILKQENVPVTVFVNASYLVPVAEKI